jgi:hypothetical protein
MPETPFFPAFRARLAALGRRSAAFLRQATVSQLQELLAPLIPAAVLAPPATGPNSRQRVFHLRFTFECFLWQVLQPGTSCRAVRTHVQTLLREQGRPLADGDDSAYVQARQRLPRESFEQALSATAQVAARRAGTSRQLRGRPVKVTDGSTTQLADTPKNQKRYPQSRSQKPGCGFPLLKFVVLFCLRSGALLHVAMGSLRHHDLRLCRQLWPHLKTGDILLGDRAWGEYTTLAGLPAQGVDVVARLHARRTADFRRARRLGRGDGLFAWHKSANQSEILSAAQWQALPEQITVRVIRFTPAFRGFRSRQITLVTTLLDAAAYPAEELIALYARRWRLELCLRDLKTTLGMETLRCKTPDMAEKELLAYLVAHNVIRCVMAEAMAQHEVELECLSFKGTVDAFRPYSIAIAKARSRKLRRQLWADLLWNVARDRLPVRPGRVEPRAVKRRPKPYPLLNQPRRRFKDIPHRNRYWKGRPRKTTRPI